MTAEPADAWARVYRVKKGDWLGKIGRRFLPGDPFGKNGSVQQIVRLNPDIHHPDAIVPDELVYIPDVPARAPTKKHAPKAAWAQAPRTRPKVTAPVACVALPPPPAPPCKCEAPKEAAPPHPLPPPENPLAEAQKATPQAGPDNFAPSPEHVADAKACHCPTVSCTCEAEKACVCPTLELACKPQATTTLQGMPDAQTATADASRGGVGRGMLRHLRIRLAPYFRFSELAAQDDATGAALTLVSRYNTGLGAGLSINALEHLEVSLDLRGGMLDYASPTKNSALLTSALFSYAAHAGAELTILHRLGIYLGVGYGNEPFSASDSTQVQEVEMIALPAAMGALRLTAVRFDHWLLGAEAWGTYKLGAALKNYTVHPGTVLYAGAYWQWFQPDDTAWTVSAGYAQRQQDTTLITQTDKNIVVELSYRWSIEKL